MYYLLFRSLWYTKTNKLSKGATEMNTRDILNAAKEELTSLDSHLIDVLDIKPHH